MSSKYRKIEKSINFIFGKLIEIVIYLISIILGKYFKKKNKNTVLIIKILGGGSLFSVLPILLQIKKKRKEEKILLICSSNILPFAEAMKIFDEINVIRFNFYFLIDLVKALKNFIKSEKVISLEMHSKLVTLFQVMFPGTKVIVNIPRGYFKNYLKSKKNYFVSYNHSTSYYEFYLKVFRYFYEIEKKISYKTVKNFLLKKKGEIKNIKSLSQIQEKPYIVLAPFCSNLSVEREISPKDYLNYISKNIMKTKNIILIGGSDVLYNSQKAYSDLFKNNKYNIINLVGKLSLLNNLYISSNANITLTIDSGFNHAARYVAKKIVSFWGPTHPNLHISKIRKNEIIHYKKVYCSPCVHFTNKMACGGFPNNFCQKNIIKDKYIFKIKTL